MPKKKSHVGTVRVRIWSLTFPPTSAEYVSPCVHSHACKNTISSLCTMCQISPTSLMSHRIRRFVRRWLTCITTLRPVSIKLMLLLLLLWRELYSITTHHNQILMMRCIIIWRRGCEVASVGNILLLLLYERRHCVLWMTTSMRIIKSRRMRRLMMMGM